MVYGALVIRYGVSKRSFKKAMPGLFVNLFLMILVGKKNDYWWWIRGHIEWMINLRVFLFVWTAVDVVDNSRLITESSWLSKPPSSWLVWFIVSKVLLKTDIFYRNGLRISSRIFVSSVSAPILFDISQRRLDLRCAIALLYEASRRGRLISHLNL